MDGSDCAYRAIDDDNPAKNAERQESEPTRDRLKVVNHIFLRTPVVLLFI